MSKAIIRMTRKELQNLIASTVEQKLTELLGDPDSGQALRKKVRAQLLRQKKTRSEG